MARSRNIKPGLFSNDILAECDIYARFLFTGLWTIADRSGRLEDRPKKIKAELLPYDNCDGNDLLQQLADRGFILRYEVDHIKYIQILNFDKHQNPHKNEAESIIPAPDKHSTSTVQIGLIPDSLPLIPDSLNSHSNAGARNPKIKLEDLSIEDIQPWIDQQAVRAVAITIDVGEELERFRAHFLAYGGKDKNGNAVSDWVAKFGSWVLNEQKQQKHGAKNQPPSNQARGSPRDYGQEATDKNDRILQAILRQQAENETDGSDSGDSRTDD